MFLVTYKWRKNEENTEWAWNTYTFQNRFEAEDSYDRLKSYGPDHKVLYTDIMVAEVLER